MRGTFLCVKKNNNNQELCPLTSVTRKGRESNFGPSQDLREWYISSLQPQKKKKIVKQRRVRDHHIFESGLLCDFCDAFKGKKMQMVIPCPFSWVAFSLQLWWDSSLLHIRWQTGRQKGSWSINTHPQPLCKTLEALRHLLPWWWLTLSAP